MRKKCEFQFFDLKQTLELKSTLEPKLDLSHMPEPILVPEHFTLEPKSTIQPSHILLLDQGIDHNDSKMVFQDWSYKEDNFHDMILHDPIHVEDCKNVNKKEVIKGGFRELLHYLNWAATLDPIRSPLEPPP